MSASRVFAFIGMDATHQLLIVEKRNTYLDLKSAARALQVPLNDECVGHAPFLLKLLAATVNRHEMRRYFPKTYDAEAHAKIKDHPTVKQFLELDTSSFVSPEDAVRELQSLCAWSIIQDTELEAELLLAYCTMYHSNRPSYGNAA